MRVGPKKPAWTLKTIGMPYIVGKGAMKAIDLLIKRKAQAKQQFIIDYLLASGSIFGSGSNFGTLEYETYVARLGLS